MNQGAARVVLYGVVWFCRENNSITDALFDDMVDL